MQTISEILSPKLLGDREGWRALSLLLVVPGFLPLYLRPLPEACSPPRHACHTAPACPAASPLFQHCFQSTPSPPPFPTHSRPPGHNFPLPVVATLCSSQSWQPPFSSFLPFAAAPLLLPPRLPGAAVLTQPVWRFVHGFCASCSVGSGLGPWALIKSNGKNQHHPADCNFFSA